MILYFWLSLLWLCLSSQFSSGPEVSIAEYWTNEHFLFQISAVPLIPLIENPFVCKYRALQANTEAMSTTNKSENDVIVVVVDLNRDRISPFRLLGGGRESHKGVHVTALALLYTRSKAITMVVSVNDIGERTIHQATWHARIIINANIAVDWDLWWHIIA